MRTKGACSLRRVAGCFPFSACWLISTQAAQK